MQSIAIKAPVRPTPALQCVMMGAEADTAEFSALTFLRNIKNGVG
jgi:hypothetical protein